MRVTSIGAVVVVAITLASVISLTYVNYEQTKKMKYAEQMERMKSEAQAGLYEAETTLVDAWDALNPASASMQDLTESLKVSEEYLTKAKTLFDYDTEV